MNPEPFDFDLSEVIRPLSCTWATQFRSWAWQEVQRVLQSPDEVGINQCLLAILKAYYEYRSDIPAKHRAEDGSYKQHVCLLQVMDECYHKLRATQRVLRPEPLYLPRSRRVKKEQSLDELVNHSILGELLEP